MKAIRITKSPRGQTWRNSGRCRFTASASTQTSARRRWKSSNDSNGRRTAGQGNLPDPLCRGENGYKWKILEFAKEVDFCSDWLAGADWRLVGVPPRKAFHQPESERGGAVCCGFGAAADLHGKAGRESSRHERTSDDLRSRQQAVLAAFGFHDFEWAGRARSSVTDGG